MANRWNDRPDQPPGPQRSQDWRSSDRDDADRYGDRYGDRPRGGMRRDDERDSDWRPADRGRGDRTRDFGAYGDLDREGGSGMAGSRGSAAAGSYADRPHTAAGRDEDQGSPQGHSAAARAAGPHRGKGPKGYVRSDERISEEVSDRLSDDDMLDASDITVKVSEGEVTLEGFVESRMARRAAEDCVEGCSGVTHVQNNLRVRDAGAQAGAQSGAGRSRSK